MFDWTWHIAGPNLLLTLGLIVWLLRWYVPGLLRQERREALEAVKTELPPAIVPYLFNHEKMQEMNARLERLEGKANYLDARIDVHIKGVHAGLEPEDQG